MTIYSSPNLIEFYSYLDLLLKPPQLILPKPIVYDLRPSRTKSIDS